MLLAEAVPFGNTSVFNVLIADALAETPVVGLLTVLSRLSILLAAAVPFGNTSDVRMLTAPEVALRPVVG
jgi:hypothetical protein